FTYDSRGMVSAITRGTGAGARMTTWGYDTLDRPVTITDPISRVTTTGYDAANRPATTADPGGNLMFLSYDPAGRATSITPPGRPAHLFSYTAAGDEQSYTPPPVSGAGGALGHSYDLDQQPLVVSRPDGSSINLTYDSAGRLATVKYPAGP